MKERISLALFVAALTLSAFAIAAPPAAPSSADVVASAKALTRAALEHPETAKFSKVQILEQRGKRYLVEIIVSAAGDNGARFQLGYIAIVNPAKKAYNSEGDLDDIEMITLPRTKAETDSFKKWKGWK